ncbi:MAG TPA: HlyD family efflux transporter periplasmic adaptor subunit [Chitinophaga sp.]|uniref:HlyD family efflux transporter periplasmic adaptor subunit n=1 Tax=Chitinophaga sp. TaxID=1869181 RepID=UPI002B525155|nr:HlyD family efflux transporter periplasmic adaptor subunit [Chitinophaga sp.]HVI45999.1 HlyD family efflux transporter periplasmic adaptor subunit [Chitinophaga sp.]
MPEQILLAESSLVSDEMNEVLGTSPSMIMRLGNILLLGAIAVMITIAVFVRYPDQIRGRATVLPVIPPQDITIQQGTVVQTIYVHNGDIIHKGQPLVSLAGSKETLTAAAGGRVVLQQAVEAGVPAAAAGLLMSIIPPQQQYYTTVTLPAEGSGKIRIGQQVIIDLANYPSAEFGSLTGTVFSNPLPDGKNSATVAVRLDRDGATTYNKKPEIYKGLSGEAKIVTANRRLIHRLFSFIQ